METRTNIIGQIDAALRDMEATGWLESWERPMDAGPIRYRWTDAFGVSREMRPGEMADWLNECGYNVALGR